MRIVTYDVECFAHNNLVTFKDMETGRFTCIWDDNEAVRECITESSVYFGFNSKHYDKYIIKAIACDCTPQEVKQVNDWIITEGQEGWECPLLIDKFFYFNNADIMDDMQQGQSLKSLEGHLGLPIRESTVPFDIDRPLTEKEKQEVEEYCKHDVNTTERIIKIRKDYLQNKINIGKLAGLSEAKALSMTNAKLTAAMLRARKQPHNDERQYVYPDNLRREYIPQEVFDYFNRMYDPNLTDEQVFKGEKLNIAIGDCEITIAQGGIHGSIPTYKWEEQE